VNGGGEVLEIKKTYRFRRNNLEVDYLLTNLTPRTLNFPWGTEINLALSDDADKRSISINTEESENNGSDRRGRDKNVESWTLLDTERDVMMLFTLSEPAELWSFPVFADYRVGRELRRKYQSSFFMPCWNVELPPLGTHSYKINLRIGRLKNR